MNGDFISSRANRDEVEPFVVIQIADSGNALALEIFVFVETNFNVVKPCGRALPEIVSAEVIQSVDLRLSL